MPSDKFGRTDTVSSTSAPVIERVGLNLAQVSDLFLQRDGSNIATGDINLDSNKLVNVRNHVTEQDAATKNMLTMLFIGKVSKRADLMLSVGSDHLHELSCSDLNANSGFSLLLGNDHNKMKYRLTHPILIESSNGFITCLHGSARQVVIGRRV